MTDAVTFYVTSTLLVGEMPTHLSGILTWCDEVPQAVRGLRAGASVVLPVGDFDLARQILLAMGLDSSWANFCIAVSQGVWQGDITGLPES